MSRRRTLTITTALVLAIGAAFVVPAFAASTAVPQRLLDQLANCQDARAAATTPHAQAWAEDCVAGIQAAIDAWVTAHPEPTATASPTGTTVAPTPSPTATTPPATTTPPVTTPPATTPPAGKFPDATNTGVPAFTTLTAYTGPCTITAAGTVIDAKTVNCDLTIQTTGVKITRSKVNGNVYADDNSAYSFSIADSEVSAGQGVTAVGAVNFTATRVNIHGGNRGLYCYHDCVVSDSWVHGGVITPGSSEHASGMRADHNTTFQHNRVSCDVPDNGKGGGCSASITMYPDWGAVTNVLIQGNFIGKTPGYFCAYGGNTATKPGSNLAANATYIRFIGNTFERGPSGRCSGPSDGWAITDFAAGRTGNVWSGNVWDTDGKPVASDKP